ncbi:hypothetical protein [Pseudoduganella violacea]|uniref:Uncharacterized protein n=1 Tax=Pseudoduganella violacea TaxID=1715466 RepID=A0A7W5B7A4_9BURK|nr:hypothetical protein [Pseudoduganella violacea]MBB3117475.1 hypothetical protein [Pseudoduganella violacea]
MSNCLSIAKSKNEDVLLTVSLELDGQRHEVTLWGDDDTLPCFAHTLGKIVHQGAALALQLGHFGPGFAGDAVNLRFSHAAPQQLGIDATLLAEEDKGRMPPRQFNIRCEAHAAAAFLQALTQLDGEARGQAQLSLLPPNQAPL